MDLVSVATGKEPGKEKPSPIDACLFCQAWATQAQHCLCYARSDGGTAEWSPRRGAGTKPGTGGAEVPVTPTLTPAAS